jgi:hypothetical protein
LTDEQLETVAGGETPVAGLIIGTALTLFFGGVGIYGDSHNHCDNE